VAGKLSRISRLVKDIAVNPLYLEAAREIDAKFNLSISEGHTALVYIFDRHAFFREQEVVAVKMVVFEKGDQIEIRTTDRQ